MGFHRLGIRAELVQAVTTLGWSAPTGVQQAVIPALLSREDLLVSAQTGTGKSGSFLLPLLQQLDGVACAPQTAQVLILVPTRELAEQITQVAQQLASALPSPPRALLLIGGVDIGAQEEALAQGAHLLVATPGRLLELIKRETLGLAQIDALVLDEADRLLDMGFIKEMQQILALLPAKRQSLLFSATFSAALLDLAAQLLNNPKRIEIAPSNSVATAIQEQGYSVNKGSKGAMLIHLLKQHAWPSALIFVATRDEADSLVKRLGKAGFQAEALHGDKSQEERSSVLARFRGGDLSLLVATDLAARGVDIEALPLVINYALPEAANVYVHRIGRTGRAGRDGMALSLICHGDLPALAAIEALTGRPIPLQSLPEFPVTDKPAQETERKRPPRDKQANRRTAQKRSIKQFTARKP